MYYHFILKGLIFNGIIALSSNGNTINVWAVYSMQEINKKTLVMHLYRPSLWVLFLGKSIIHNHEILK